MHCVSVQASVHAQCRQRLRMPSAACRRQADSTPEPAAWWPHRVCARLARNRALLHLLAALQGKKQDGHQTSCVKAGSSCLPDARAGTQLADQARWACVFPASTAQPLPTALPPHHSVAGDTYHHREARTLQHKQAIAAVSLAGRLEVAGRRACGVGWGEAAHDGQSVEMPSSRGGGQHAAQCARMVTGQRHRGGTKPLKPVTHSHNRHLQPHPHRSWCWC